MKNLIGKYYEMLNIDGSSMIRFKIKKVKKEIIPVVYHSDGSVSPSRIDILVSENGSGWYKIYGGTSDRIVKPKT